MRTRTKGQQNSVQYEQVTNDEWDTRVPLHPDEAFANGIHFQAKVSVHEYFSFWGLFGLVQVQETVLYAAGDIWADEEKNIPGHEVILYSGYVVD